MRGDSDLFNELTAVRADRDRLRIGCHPACPECGLKPNNESGLAVLHCDECYAELQAERDRLQGEVEKLKQLLAFEAEDHAETKADRDRLRQLLAGLLGTCSVCDGGKYPDCDYCGPTRAALEEK